MDQKEIFIEIVCPTLISEIDEKSMLKSILKTKKILIIEEGNGFASFGSELISTLCSIHNKGVLINRLNNSSVVPASSLAESAVLPSQTSIYNTILTMIDE